MTLRHMRIFLAVCEHSNMTSAATQLFMTQPAVSQAIKELEEYYGVTLFDRLSRKLYLTNSGEMLYKYASNIVTSFEETEKNIKCNDYETTLCIATNITVGTTMINKYIQEFKKIFPKVEIRIINNSRYIKKLIDKNKVDFALIENTDYDKFLVTEYFNKDKLGIIASYDNPISKKKKIFFYDIKDQDFLLRERGSGARELFEQKVLEEGYKISIAWESCSSEALINAAANNIGIAVIPIRIAKEYIQKKIVKELDVIDLDLSRNLNIVYNKNKMLSKVAKEFIDVCKKVDDI